MTYPCAREELLQRQRPRGGRGGSSLLPDARALGPPAGEHRHARRAAHRDLRIGVVEADAARGQPVDRRRLHGRRPTRPACALRSSIDDQQHVARPSRGREAGGAGGGCVAGRRAGPEQRASSAIVDACSGRAARFVTSPGSAVVIVELAAAVGPLRVAQARACARCAPRGRPCAEPTTASRAAPRLPDPPAAAAGSAPRARARPAARAGRERSARRRAWRRAAAWRGRDARGPAWRRPASRGARRRRARPDARAGRERRGRAAGRRPRSSPFRVPRARCPRGAAPARGRPRASVRAPRQGRAAAPDPTRPAASRSRAGPRRSRGRAWRSEAALVHWLPRASPAAAGLARSRDPPQRGRRSGHDAHGSTSRAATGRRSRPGTRRARGRAGPLPSRAGAP